MKIQCPKCRRTVPANQVNISTDLALCPACSEGFKVSESIDLDSVSAETLRDPPNGAWFRKEMDRIVVGASTRSPQALFIIPFMCVWSGLSLFGIYGRQIISGEFNLTSSLFGIPFILGSILLGAHALMTVCGKVEVSIGRTSSVFVGVGYLGSTHSFDWASIQTIREEQPDGDQGAIVLQGKERLKFGELLNQKRRHFVLNALKYLRAETR
jgi:hypothetical protein